MRLVTGGCDSTVKVHVLAAYASGGCPLSPFLFVMLITVLMKDAVDVLAEEDKAALADGHLAELLYADDTLLLGIHADSVERYMAAISQVGKRFGLEFLPNPFENWSEKLLVILLMDTLSHHHPHQ